jgi:CheY-like chemotaxis protein
MTKVLVVDDEPQIIRALRVDLQERGDDVISAMTGRQVARWRRFATTAAAPDRCPPIRELTGDRAHASTGTRSAPFLSTVSVCGVVVHRFRFCCWVTETVVPAA